MAAASEQEIEKLASKFGISTDQVKNQIKGSSYDYGLKVLKNNAAKVSTPTSTDVIPTVESPIDNYVAKASKILAPGYNEATNSIAGATSNVIKQYDELATQTLNQEPLVRQTYANLAKELEVAETYETGVALQTGEQNIGQTRAEMAAGGISTAGAEQVGGAFRAPLTIAEQQRTAQVTQIADKYKVNRDTLQSKLEMSLSDLRKEANQYKLQGLSMAADLTKEMANLKLQYQREVLDISTKWQQSDDAKEQFKLEMQMKEKEFDFQAQMAEKQFALEQYKATHSGSGSGVSKDAARLQDLADLGRKQVISILTDPARNETVATNIWATNFNSIKAEFPELTNEDIDNLLGVPGGWNKFIQQVRS